MPELLSYRGGINWQDPPYQLGVDQCILMQNMRHRNEYMESMPGNIRFHGTALGSNPITGIFPYNNEETGAFKLLVASGGSIYERDPGSNEFTERASGYVLNSMVSSTQRHNTLYIAEGSTIKKFTGGTIVENVGGGATAPGAFRQVLYMKEVDRLFGIRQSAVLGQIGWSDFQDPETWDPTSVDRIKLQDGETTEWAEILYGKLIIINTYSIWIYYVSGNEENWRLEQAPVDVGTVAFKTVKKVGNEIWFLGESPKRVRGVYAFNGSTVRLLTYDINPLIARINREKIGNCCAELHDGLYTLSFPFDASITNNMSIDLDTLVLKEDSTPAVYGPHDIFFYSSAVLDGKNNTKQFLMGDESDGFVYREGGTTLKSPTTGGDGTLLRNRFLSAVYIDKGINTTKKYENISLFFKQRGFFQARFRAYFSHTQAIPTDYLENLIKTDWERLVYGTPDLSEYQQPLGVNDFGTSIQFEVINDNVGQRMAIQGVKYDASELYQGKFVQNYVS